ncbi:polysaccharide deacetylase family protein [Halpernia frigidisoli]|uniref:Peptidoglycan/xylan/chitin deacetylase, PgdA/CDA1 family n=1 Tax=Halpernia frigidisoli TaxID=1125876 RepID=A0A1I3DWR8_9FLAO|nr:polysaccharide deacetylase family protein [Halpernia frigidisoli]SFH91194.1 Peptidoglycan/xylan/chitin deacetylase, PgdA/CDA1 family [Halpernia frigidisoli]
MTTNFNKKSNSLAFLGLATIALAGISILFLHSCKKESINQKSVVKKNNRNIDEENKLRSLAKPEESVDNRRTIYLTFDDGPNRGTENLVKIINERKVPATAFIVGQHVFGSKKQKADFEILKNDSYFELANHSYTHASNKYEKFYENSEEVVADFDRAKDSLKLKNNIARTPGRNIWRTDSFNITDVKKSKNSADDLANKHYKLIGWDLEWLPTKDMKLKNTNEEMIKMVDSIFYNDLEKTSRHLVLLTHDQYLKDDNSVNELKLFIQKLQNSRRFQFKKISQYPNVNELLE